LSYIHHHTGKIRFFPRRVKEIYRIEVIVCPTECGMKMLSSSAIALSMCV